MRAISAIRLNRAQKPDGEWALALEVGNTMVGLRGSNRRRWKWFFTLFLVCVSWNAAWAGHVYVSDTTLETVLRSGPGFNNRNISMVQAGTRVKAIGERENWAEVALEDGRTGWMLKKYLAEQPPWRIRAEKLAAENKTLQTQMAQMVRGKQDLSEETANLRKELDATRRELESVRHEYETLKKGAAEYLDLKTSFDKLTTDANQVRERLAEAQEGYENLKTSTTIHWFLSGAGVLVFGWILGLMMARTRSRRVSGLYR